MSVCHPLPGLGSNSPTHNLKRPHHTNTYSLAACHPLPGATPHTHSFKRPYATNTYNFPNTVTRCMGWLPTNWRRTACGSRFLAMLPCMARTTRLDSLACDIVARRGVVTRHSHSNRALNERSEDAALIGTTMILAARRNTSDSISLHMTPSALFHDHSHDITDSHLLNRPAEGCYNTDEACSTAQPTCLGQSRLMYLQKLMLSKRDTQLQLLVVFHV